ncbi:MAG: nitrous oxide-stimulated promoter family protein [Nitrospinae bacterium]|nr:nitrous oxide-stimulated promoter family protein [Nitrospinota bacterium]
MSANIPREISIIGEMIGIYCRGKHSDIKNSGNLCKECASLLEYAEGKLRKCPYQEEKPSCKDCSIHCYSREYRVTIRDVMKYSGWRFMVRPPLESLLKYIS